MELKKFISLISAAAITASAFSTLGVYAESEDAAGTNETEVSQRVSEDNSGKTASVEEELVSPAAYDTSDAVENSADTEKDVSNESMPKATLRPEPNDGAVEVTAEPQPSSDVQLAAESNWNAYTAAYDSDGRLTAIYKTSDIVPSDADTSINYEMLKTFVWDDNCIPYINSNEVMFKKDDYRCIRNNDGEGYSIMVYLDDIKSKYVSYKLSSDLKICINGKEYTYTIEDIEKFITSNYLGNVTLRDIPNAESGETDGIYDEIDIQYFLDGCIEEVTAGDYGRYSICFDKYEYEMGREILVLDEYKNYSIKLNGKEISPSELKQGDVLSVAYDIKGNFHNSDDYEIYVSRETKHLNVTDVFDDDSNQKITAADGKTYVTAYADAANMSAAKEYEVGFDIFGKIAYANEITSPVQYAILENLYATNGGIDYYADIITASGEKKSYPVTKDDYDAFINILMMDSEKFDTDEKLLNRQEPQNRVIEYVINSKGELNVKRTVYPWIFEGEYDAESNRLDGNKLDSEVSKILDISDYRNDESRGYPAVSLSDFRDSISYKGYVFGMTSNGSYQFVIITSGIGGYHVTDGWGVYVTGEKVSTPDGYKDAVTAYVNSELKTIPIDVPDEDLSTGDIFFYTTNPDGYIDDIRKVSSTGYTYRDMFKKAIDSNFDIINSETAEQFSGSSSKNNFAQDNCSPNMLVSGFIINNYGLSVTMATKYDLSKNNTITAFDLDRCKEYYFANDMTVYKYDYSVGNLKNRISTAKKTDIESLRFFGNSYVDNALNFETEYENLLYEKDDNCGSAVFAVAKIVNDAITEILIMTPPYKYSGFIKKANAEVNISDIYYFDSYEEEPSILNVYKDESKGDYDRYKISQNAEIKVNGIKVSMSLDDLMNSNIVTGNRAGTIKLTDLPEKSGGKTDGIYDEIDVSYYVSGIVDSVEEKDGEYTIRFGNADSVINSGNLKLDSSKKYTITLDGKEIAPSELKQGNVLSAAYDVNANFENSGSYTILVSRNVFEGVVTSVSNDTNAVDVEYKFDNGNTYHIAYEGAASLKSGTAYTVYVDALGRIVYANEITSLVQYAILENLYTTNGSANYYADIITASGEKKSYQVMSGDYRAFVRILMSDESKFDTSEKLLNRKNIEDRVIEYVVTAKNILKLRDDWNKTAVTGNEINGTYSSGTNSIGNVKFRDGVTSILDASNYKSSESQSLSQINQSNFVDDLGYSGYAFGKLVDGSYQFVIIKSGIGGYYVEDSMAVYVGSEYIYDNDTYKPGVKLYQNGELRIVPIEDESLTEQFSTGTVFFYTMNYDGEINDVRVVSDEEFTYRDMLKSVLEKNFDFINRDTASQFSGIDRYKVFKQGKHENNCLISGVIVGKDGNKLSVASSTDNQSLDSFDTKKCSVYELSSELNVYVYDYSVNKIMYRVSNAGEGAVRAAKFDDGSYVGSQADGIVNFNAEINAISEKANINYGNVNLAVAKVVDGVITEIVVIVPSADEE